MYRGMIIHRSLSGVLLVGLLWSLVQHSSAGCTVDCCGQNTRCCFQIQEGDQLGRFVGNASELPEFQSTLTLSLQSVNFVLGNSQYSTSLAINDNNGVVTTAAPFDRENFDNCFSQTVNLAYQVAGNPTMVGTTGNFFLVVLDVNDNSPVFNAPSPVTVTAPETPTAMPEFVCSSSLIARDADDLVNTPLNYTIIGNPNFTAAYDGGSVAVCISNLVGVDRETTPLIELTLEAVDNGSPPRSSNVTVIIQVTDINDNSPNFQIPSPKILSVPENTAVNHVLYSFNAIDRDDGVNAQITYSISPPQQSFAINSSTGDLYSTEPLEFDGKSDEMNSFQFNVIASDSATEPRMTSLQVVVNIVDVNDNAPILANSVPDFLYIVEGKLVKPSVRFQLKDADSGVNRIVRAVVTSGCNFYTVSNGTELIFANIFVFDLITKVPLVDRETTNQIDLAILFYDQGVPSLNVTVTSTIIVEDINDNAPTLNRTNFSILENVLVGNSIVNLETYFFDPDNGSNGTLDRVVQLSESNLIEVSNKGLLRLRKSLDREMHEVIEVRLQIFDAGTPQLNSTITVYIRLLDVNDNSPTFDPPSYMFSIRENDKGYQNIGQVMARDPDNGRNGTVEYRIMNSTSLFAIDNTTGYISTNETFDREMQPSYTLIVLASDHGTPPKSTTTIVIVGVTDVNDEQPIFDRQRIEITISTYTPAGSTIGQVNATDPDENSHLRYSLSGDGANQFRINNTTGVITTAQIISGEPMDQWMLTVTASDGIFSTTAQVIITVTEPLGNTLTVIVIASSAVAISVVITIALFATFMLYTIYKCRRRKSVSLSTLDVPIKPSLKPTPKHIDKDISIAPASPTGISKSPTVNFSEEVAVQIYSELTPAKRRYETVCLRSSQQENSDGQEIEMQSTAKSSPPLPRSKPPVSPPLNDELSGSSSTISNNFPTYMPPSTAHSVPVLREEVLKEHNRVYSEGNMLQGSYPHAVVERPMDDGDNGTYPDDESNFPEAFPADLRHYISNIHPGHSNPSISVPVSRLVSQSASPPSQDSSPTIQYIPRSSHRQSDAMYYSHDPKLQSLHYHDHHLYRHPMPNSHHQNGIRRHHYSSSSSSSQQTLTELPPGLPHTHAHYPPPPPLPHHHQQPLHLYMNGNMGLHPPPTHYHHHPPPPPPPPPHPTILPPTHPQHARYSSFASEDNNTFASSMLEEMLEFDPDPLVHYDPLSLTDDVRPNIDIGQH